jgi:hypothetical protein
VGYARLFERYGLDDELLARLSFIRDDTRPRQVSIEGRQLVETFPRAYARGDEDFDHLVFALKYDGVDPYALARILATTDRDELTARIAAKPNSKYARLLFFLCEHLAQIDLALPDASGGGWVPVLDPERYFTAAGVPSQRHRVIDNLLGDHRFCPIVRRTPALTDAIAKRLDERARELTRDVDPALLARATWYLYTKETKSSFAIEHEEPGDKIDRYVQQLATVGRLPLDTVDGLVDLQNSLVHPNYAERGFRRDFEVYVGQTIGYRERVHYIGVPSAVTPELMDGWLDLREVVEEGGAVVEAACRSFAFVFIHPFGDGNGRIHRLLLHHVLAKRGYMPDGIVVPISSVLVNDLRSYDEALEAFSTQVMRHSKYTLDADGELTIRDTDVDIYRFPDLTVQAEATFIWLERAIVDEMVHELEFLRSYDQALSCMREIIEMPDRKEQLFIKLCLSNRGSLSARKRSKFAELDDATVAALEAVVREALGIEGP